MSGASSTPGAPISPAGRRPRCRPTPAPAPPRLPTAARRPPGRAGGAAAGCAPEARPGPRRSHGNAIASDTAVYLADTLGEMGLLYRLADIAFIGGSLTPMGGHNPLEAALLGCAILHGRDMSNCIATVEELAAAGGATSVGGVDELAGALDRLLADPGERRRRGKAAGAVATRDNGVLDNVLGRLAPLLDAIAPLRGKSDRGTEN